MSRWPVEEQTAPFRAARARLFARHSYDELPMAAIATATSTARPSARCCCGALEGALGEPL